MVEMVEIMVEMVEIIRDQQSREIEGERGPGGDQERPEMVRWLYTELELGWVQGRRDGGR